MLDRAIIEMKADKAKAVTKFNHNDWPFRDRDLFVFCFNGQNGEFTAHEAMVTRMSRTLRDKTGKPFGKQMYQSAKEDQVVEIAYILPVPGSTELASRRAHVMRVGDQVCEVSAYHYNAPGEPKE